MALTNMTLTPVSGNTKIGPIPATYRTMDTCPTDCPFYPDRAGGCYGTGRIFGIARKNAQTLTTDDLDSRLSKVRKGARFLRDRVVGDILTPDGRVDFDYVAAIAKAGARHGLRVFGYTHAWRLLDRDDVTRIKQEGYVMNASCETEQDVRQAVDLGMPVVLTGDEWEDGQMIAGKRVVTCPAQTRDNVTCATCGLCASPNRKAVVRFMVHGTARRKAAASIDERKGE